MAKVLEFEAEIKSSADKFWGAIKDSTDIFPKIFPDHYYKSIKILEGDGKRGSGLPIVTFAKERIEVADETNMILAHSVIEAGELPSFYKNYKTTLQVVPKEDGSCSVKVSLAYEQAKRASEQVIDPRTTNGGFNDEETRAIACFCHGTSSAVG